MALLDNDAEEVLSAGVNVDGTPQKNFDGRNPPVGPVESA